jgi:predicted RNA-binding Zn-ribbon protein involved in translation (DUF1610 family)
MTIQLVNRDLEAMALARLRRLRRTTWIVWLAGVPVMWAVMVVFGSARQAFVVGAVWAASFVALSLTIASFRCPRCGNLYHIRWGVGGNAWVKRCMHCGLELRGRSDAY